MKTTIFNKARLMGTCFLWAALATGGVLTSCSDDDDLTALTSPTGSEAAEVTATSLTFSWNKVSGVNQYGLVLKNEAGETVATDVTTAHTATFYGLQPGKTYTLEVTAYAGLGTDYANSKPLVLTGTTLSFIQLEAPVVTANPAARTEISWAAVENATTYTYTYEKDGETVTGSTNDTSFTIDFLPLDTDVTIQVTASNEEDELYTPSETASVVAKRTRNEVSRVKGIIDGTSTQVTCVSYDDNSYTLEGWYGVEGYDLTFLVDTQNDWIVTDTYYGGGFNWAATGVDANGMWFVTTYSGYSGFYGTMRKGGVWFYIYTTDYELYSVTWPAEEEEEDLGELIAANVPFSYATYIETFYSDLYKATQADGTEIYTFKNFFEDFDLKFTVDDQGNMSFTNLNNINYAGYTYSLFGADWYTSAPMYLTSEPGYYIDYSYFYPGSCHIYWDNSNWSYLYLYYWKYDASGNYVNGQDYGEYIYFYLP
jgi:hypothetical protein